MNESDLSGEKSTRDHWDGEWVAAPRPRLPSGLNVGVGDVKHLLKTSVPLGVQFLEIGCAPGKMLAWVAVSRKAKVAGLDYSKIGLEHTRNLFNQLGLNGDLRCEKLSETTFQPASFDIVFSNGLIEHFADPTKIVEQHVMLLKPGGRAIIAIPNYGGIYGSIMRKFDPGNLDIHNLEIMHLDTLKALAPTNLVFDIKTYSYGRVSPWIINFPKNWPRFLVVGINYFFNGIGLIQPFQIKPLSPMLVLEMTRRFDSV